MTFLKLCMLPHSAQYFKLNILIVAEGIKNSIYEI